ncbi:hypothetical protein [Mesobacillus subterraneus]|uniref:Uncharacterized protein n=1 Tax=Mesobacillus subterraneus TaxID=285983 RepID=A0A3R9EYB2_9BACI|nr:hypothetical protein [Mesobacillus subterraneus]RSD24977.1 hypothetical protein EJA10_18475 [Mesobacillus subterraneus]
MSRDKDSKELRRWMILIISSVAAGALWILVDVVWIKKAALVILLIIGFIGSGLLYQFYERLLDRAVKKKKNQDLK